MLHNRLTLFQKSVISNPFYSPQIPQLLKQNQEILNNKKDIYMYLPKIMRQLKHVGKRICNLVSVGPKCHFFYSIPMWKLSNAMNASRAFPGMVL